MRAARILASGILAAVSFGAAAQSDKCQESLKAYEAVVAAHEYNEALVQYKALADKCPKVDEKLYRLGERVYNYQVEASQNNDERSRLIAGLFDLYAAYDKNYPANTNANLARKAMVLKNFKLADEQEQYKLLDQAFSASRKSFTDYNAIETLFLLSQQQAAAGKISQSQFIERYGALSAQVSFARQAMADRKAAIEKKSETTPVTDEDREFLAAYNATADALDAVRENMDVLARNKISCGDLEAYYNSRYDASSKDAAWLEAAVTVMSSGKCYTSPVLEKASRAFYEASPSVQSAYLLGNVLLRKGKGREATLYFDKAASLEQDAVKKAELYYTLASIYRTLDKAKAKEYVLRSAALNPKSGRPYLFLAEMYSSVTKDCELNDFERKALMWLAADAAQKAAATEQRYKATVASMVQGYQKRQPTKAEAKAAGKRKGDQVAFGCWINETVTVPAL